MIKVFKNICAQGDVLIRRVEKIPASVTHVGPVDGVVIVTHSETGHHHTIALDRVVGDVPSVEMFQCTDNPLLAWIRVNRPTALEHQRPFDTHAPIMLGPGVYEVRRQREYAPEGWRQVAD